MLIKRLDPIRITMDGINGRDYRRVMRKHKVTIRELSRRMNVSMKSIRRHRVNGASFIDYLSLIEFCRNDGQGLTERELAMLNDYRKHRMS